MAARRGIRSITGLLSGGSVNVPTPNPPVAPPPAPPLTQQIVSLGVVVNTPTVFAPTVTRVSGLQNISLPLVVNTPTVLPLTVSTASLSDNFDTGSTPNAAIWGASNVSTGGVVDLNNSQLRLTSGVLGSYLDHCYLPSLYTVTNFESTFDVIIPATTECFLHYGFRGSGTQDTIAGHRGKQTTGCIFELAPASNYISVEVRSGGVSTTRASAAITWAAGDVAHVRLLVLDSSIRARVWRNAETEPLSWQIDTTDATFAGGKLWIGLNAGQDTIADTIRIDNVYAAFSNQAPPVGGGGGNYLDPPTAEAIAGMNPTPAWDFDWTGATPLAGWDVFDGSGNANNERSQPRAANATIVTGETGTTGNAYLRLIVRRETYFGLPLTGVQMENAGVRIGQGATFYVEVRLRWTGYLGFWGGPWLLQYPQSPNAEMDVMETVNNRPPWTTSHSPSIPTQAYTATNDGGWHRYGIRVDGQTVRYYYDNAEVTAIRVTNATTSSAFMNAFMFPKIQHLAGGNFPNGDNGSTIPDSSLPFTDKYFDVDYYRIYRQGAGPPPPPPGGTTRQVPAQGTLQQVADAAQPGDTIVVSGVNSYSGKVLHLNNRDNGANPITIIGNPGNILRGTESGIEGYGSNRGWTFQNLNIEVHGGNNAPFGSNSARYGEGIYFAGERTDQGGDGQGCANIRVIGCTVKPIAGTGTVQRSGVSVWGGDGIEIGNCDITDVGYNDNGGNFGGAASGISIGHSIRHAATSSFANGTRVWIHQNKVRNVIGPGTSSADRNALIVDLFHGGTNGVFYTNRSIGKILIEGNDFANCEGRGIQILCAGAADSQVEITANLVRAPMATNLGGSEPIAGIGGYGIGVCGNIVCNNNDVTVSSGAYAYSFFSFNGAMDASISGVRGSGNIGQPRNFSGSAPGF